MKSIRTKLLWSHVALAVITAVVLPAAVWRFTFGQFLDQLERQLRYQATHVSEDIGYAWSEESRAVDVGRRIKERLASFARVTGTNIRLLDLKGVVLFASGDVYAGPEVGNRREVRRALGGEFRAAYRGPETSSRRCYVALPVKDRDTGAVIGATYLDAPIQPVLQIMPQMAYRLALASLLAFTLAFALSMVMSSAIARPVTQLNDAARQLSAGDFSARVQPMWQDEVAALSETFNAMAERLQRVDEERRAFLADVAHELRTPLTSIKGSAETLLSVTDEEREVAPRFLKIIVQQSDRLGRLVQELLQLARLEAGAIEMRRLPVTIPELLRDVCEELRPLANPKGVRLDIASSGEVCCTGDPAYLARVFINIIGNAIRYAPTQSEIAIGVTSDDGTVVVEVTDHGKGIAPEHLTHIFDRFYRAEAARTTESETQGSGLGLAITRRIVEAHGGTISARSQVGQGTTIVVKLPATAMVEG